MLEEWTQKVAEEHKSHWYQLRLYVHYTYEYINTGEEGICVGRDNKTLSAWYCVFAVECRPRKQSCCTSRRSRNLTALARRAFLLRYIYYCVVHCHFDWEKLCPFNICSSPTGQLHQRYFHRHVLHRSVCQTPKWQIHHAPQASLIPVFIYFCCMHDL